METRYNDEFDLEIYPFTRKYAVGIGVENAQFLAEWRHRDYDRWSNEHQAIFDAWFFPGN